MNKSWLHYLIAGMLSQSAISAYAFETFVVNEIQVEGLQRITQATVLNYVPIHPGDTLPPERSKDIIRALFETGFFQDIKLRRVGDVLVIQVVERPTIGRITLTGNKDIKTEDLTENLKAAGLAEGYVFDRSTLEQVRNEIERAYFSHGKYAVRVETLVDTLDQNRVDICINIEEGSAARIIDVNIVGNQCFSSSELLKSFTLSPTGLFSWVTKSDQYDKQKLGADLESLRNFYLDRGYLNFQILSTQVSITPDKQDIYVSINIEEGEQFCLSHYDLAGNTVIPPEELMCLIQLRGGDIFSRSAVANIVKAMTDRLGEAGFSNARINPVPELDEVNKTVSITFYVEPGQRVYVNQVLVEGNNKTKDEVIRREIIQMEAAPVNTKQIEESKTRLNRTGFFTDVKVEMRPCLGAGDEVDVVYIVEEASAGQLGGAVGYSDLDGLIFNANISNRNFMGTGKSLDLSFNHSKAYTTYSAAYNNPYYTDSGISRGFNAFYSKTDIGKATNIANYTTDATGLNMVYGMPLSPVDRLTYGFGYQNVFLKVDQEVVNNEIVFGPNVPLEIQNFINDYGPNSNEGTVAIGWMHNSFDRMVFPQRGLQQSLSLTATVPGSDLQYYRLSYTTQYYRPLCYGFIFMGSGTLGFGAGYGNTNSLPFYKNFFCGGVRTVRGFKESSLGPRDSLNKPIGGNLLVHATAAVIIPNFLSEEVKTIRLAWFFDAGQVYDTHYTNFANSLTSRNPTGIRYSTGLSLTWMSPMAPMSFSLGLPLNKQPGDWVQIPAFTFGTVF